MLSIGWLSMSDIKTKIQFCVAMNENFVLDFCEYDPNNIQKMQKYQEWIDAKRNDKILWHIKTISTDILYPYSVETI